MGPDARFERVLVVSPHLDDAVLSVGGLISRLVRSGSRVEVVTLFAGIPSGELSGTAQHIHGLCGYAPNGSAVAERRAEDAAALSRLGAGARHAGFLEAIYRTGSDGGWLCRPGRDMFDPWLAPEPALATGLRGALDRTAAVLRPDVVLGCAAIGNHVDHRLAREAAVRLGRHLDVPTLLWEDLPHAAGSPRSGPAPGAAVPWPIDRRSWQAKCEAIAVYRSQLRMLWPDGGWQHQLEAHARSWDGRGPVELLWAVPAGSRGRAIYHQENVA